MCAVCTAADAMCPGPGGAATDTIWLSLSAAAVQPNNVGSWYLIVGGVGKQVEENQEEIDSDKG
jgi:hypothetical protein